MITFELVPGASLPLALFREHSVSREGPTRARHGGARGGADWADAGAGIKTRDENRMASTRRTTVAPNQGHMSGKGRLR